MSMRVLLAVGGLLVAAQASALQPLDGFLRGARTSSTDNAEARAVRRQLAADAALGRALPGVSLRGTYTRNQYATTLGLPGVGGGPATSVTVTPHDQLDGTATLDVPLVDLASFARIAAARTSARASASQAASTELRVQALVSQDYYQLVANASLVGAARRALDVAQASLRIAEQRHSAGTTPLLDVDRARGEVERNVQQLAAAELQVSLVARALESLTGISPALQGDVQLADDIHEEPPLERFQTSDAELPALAGRSRAASPRSSRPGRSASPSFRAWARA
jgi:outer membrane protein TolC